MNIKNYMPKVQIAIGGARPHIFNCDGIMHLLPDDRVNICYIGKIKFYCISNSCYEKVYVDAKLVADHEDQ